MNFVFLVSVRSTRALVQALIRDGEDGQATGTDMYEASAKEDCEIFDQTTFETIKAQGTPAMQKTLTKHDEAEFYKLLSAGTGVTRKRLDAA